MGRGKDTPNISPKSIVTLFTSDIRQSHHQPPVTISGTPLPLKRHPKLLGVTFDPHFIFHIHARVLKERTMERLEILKALAGTDWGQRKKRSS